MKFVYNLVRRNPLFFAFLFPALTDGVITLLGQSPQYWSNQRMVNEASPAYYFLLTSPWIFILGSLIWFLVLYRVFRKLKEPINLILMFLFISGHSWGSTSWIWNLMRRNGIYDPSNQLSVISAWFLPVLYFFLIGLLATYCLRVYILMLKSRR